MKKHAKIAVSLGAVALSVGFLTIATPAMAEDLIPLDYTNSRTSADVQVRVNVVGETPYINIDTPYDGQVIRGKELPVSLTYQKSTDIAYQIIYINSDGTQTAYPEVNVSVSDSGTKDGTYNFNFRADDFGGKYGDYILRATAKGSGSAVDSVSFRLVSFDFEVEGFEETTYNPIIRIKQSPGVYKSLIQVFDMDGNAIFDAPIEAILNPSGDTEVVLPLADYGVPKGKYRIVATPYDAAGTIIDASKERTIEYNPAPAPDVPDTGNLFGALGLSREDLTSTAVALFFICAFFAVLIVAKKNKQRR